MNNAKYWNRQNETMPLREIQRRQLLQLKHIVKYCYDNTEFYRNRLDEAGVKPENINTLRDIQKIPFTTKDDLKNHYPFGVIAVDFNDIVEVHTSSGTTGNPTVAAYTQHDVNVWRELMARSIYTTGARKQDVIHVAFGYGMFTGGIGYHYGAQKIGSAVIPVSGGMTKRQIKLIKDFHATVLCCTPSFATYLAEYMIKEDVNPERDLELKLGIFGAEHWSEKMRSRIEGELNLKAYDLYGLTELCGPGVSVECEEHNGLHVWEDHFLVEIIDPETGEVRSPGEEGELVFTTLTKNGMPVLRYRTRDISALEQGKCACGRTHARMRRVVGRSDDMFFVKGVNVFPSQIEYLLMGFSKLALQYQIILDRVGTDTMIVRVELNDASLYNEHKAVTELKQLIEEEIRNVTAIRATVEIVKPGKIPRSDGKAQRVIDLRKNKI